MQLLLVKISSMGDILHTLPALTDAMQFIPDLRVDWVVEEGFNEIPAWHPTVSRVIPVAIRRWRKNWFDYLTRKERLRFKQQIQGQAYDIIIDAQGLLKSAALITRLAKGEKHGFDWHSAREPLSSLFYQHRHAVDRSLHAVERTRQLFALSLGYPIPTETGKYGISEAFQTHQAPSSPYLVFLHATARNEKQWPESYWQRLISQFTDSGIEILLPWGSEEEKQRAIRLTNGFQHAKVLPKCSLKQLAEILLKAKAIVSIDTGLSHLAAALDCPNLTLYGPTNPALIGSYGKNQLTMAADGKNLSTLSPLAVFHQLYILLQ